MEHPPGPGVTSDTPLTQAGMLRRAWADIAATVAPQLTDLPVLLDARLTDLESAASLNEPSLLAVAEDASQYALEQGAGEVARTLSKRLRRSIYEFLLALDAVNPAEMANAPAIPHATSPFAPPPAPAAPPAPVVPVAPVPDPEPRATLSIAAADVSGADDAPTAGVAPTVPLWEQVAPPEQSTREVYRVASRTVEESEPVDAGLPLDIPIADLIAADAAEIAELAAELAPVEEGTALWDPAVDAGAVGEAAADDVEVDEGTVFEPGAGADFSPNGEVHVLEPEAVAAEEWDEDAAEFTAEAPVELAAEAQPELAAEDATEFAAEDTAELVAEAAFVGGDALDAEAPVELDADVPDEAPAELAAEAPAETVAEFAAEAPAEPVAEAPAEFAAEAPTELAPEPVAETVAEAPVEFAAEAPTELSPEASAETAAEAPVELAAEPPAAAHDGMPNGVKPHRDLLRVPRQFRRLPPMAPQATDPTAPAAAADITPDQPAAWTAPASGPVEDDDDLFGVPALPWPAGMPQPQAQAPAAPPEPEQEELGVPFSPLPEPTPSAAAPAPAAPAPAAPHPQPQPARPQPVAVDPFAPVLPPLAPPGATAPVEPVAFPDLPTPPEGTAGALPWTAMPPTPAAAPFPIAPREGFHLTDPGALDMALAQSDGASPAPVDNPFTTGLPPAAVPPAAPAAPAPAAEAAAPQQATPPADADEDDPGTWRVRQSPRAQLLAERMAQKRREEAARAAYEAAAVLDERHGRKRRRGEEPVTDLPSARRQLDENLRKKRGAEAAALLQRLAQEVGGREIADLALDAGDRCRALGQSRSATNCYLAAWRSDPLYETPLWRLSDVCLNEQEIELAVGYLERIAELMRSRGDDEGAIGVYRKIAMIAPERQDVRDVIRLAKTTGRLDV